MEVDKILRDIIIEELQIDQSRVVVYNQNWNPPKDQELYIVLSTRSQKTIGSSNVYDFTTGEEIKTVNIYTYIDIDITSRNRSALERKEEIIMAITSYYGLSQQEKYQVRIWRTESTLDLSFIEAGSGLHRFRIPMVISSIREKRKAIPFYNLYSEPQQEVTN